MPSDRFMMRYVLGVLAGVCFAGACSGPAPEAESAFDESSPPSGTLVDLGKADGAWGAGKVGLSLMSLLSPRFDCGAAIDAFGDAPIAFGYLETTFGNRRACLERLLAHPRFVAMRVHVFNGPCIRNRRCAANEVLRGETTASLDRKLAGGDAALVAKIRAELVRVRDALQPHLRPGKRYYASGVLEHDLRDRRAARRMSELVREVLGPLGFRVVNSPVSGTRDAAADVQEWHGDSPSAAPPCIVDPDGTEVADFASYARRYRRCELVLGWNSNMNCLGRGEDWRPPLERRNCPTRATLASLARVVQDSARPPEPEGPIAGCYRRDTFVDGARLGNLWKPEADHQPDKAVAMFKNAYLSTARSVQVVARATNRVLREVTCDFPRFVPGGECGVYTEDGRAGRPFFRVRKPPAGEPILVQLVLRNRETVCFTDVRDPAVRYD